MSANAARVLSSPLDSEHSASALVETDTGLICLLILARFHDLPADGAQLRHQFAQSGQMLSDTDLLRAAKHLGLKAGLVETKWNKLPGTPLPAIAKRTDGRYFVVAKLEGERVLVQDPVEGRPLVFDRQQFEGIWTEELLLFTKRANVRLQDLKFDFTWFIPAIVQMSARPIGEGGTCWISKTAGRNSAARPLEATMPDSWRDSACQAAFHTVQCRDSVPNAM